MHWHLNSIQCNCHLKKNSVFPITWLPLCFTHDRKVLNAVLKKIIKYLTDASILCKIKTVYPKCSATRETQSQLFFSNTAEWRIIVTTLTAVVYVSANGWIQFDNNYRSGSSPVKIIFSIFDKQKIDLNMDLSSL